MSESKSAIANVQMVSESGLNNVSDLRRLKEHGFHGFLIGETLMRAPDPAQPLRDLLS